MATEVNIAVLKAHLSRYLRLAQQGQEILVKDRNTPIARLVPVQAAPLDLGVIPATKPLRELAKLQGIRPKRLKPGDLDEALRATKEERFDRWLASRSTSTRR